MHASLHINYIKLYFSLNVKNNRHFYLNLIQFYLSMEQMTLSVWCTPVSMKQMTVFGVNYRSMKQMTVGVWSNTAISETDGSWF